MNKKTDSRYKDKRLEKRGSQLGAIMIQRNKSVGRRPVGFGGV